VEYAAAVPTGDDGVERGTTAWKVDDVRVRDEGARVKGNEVKVKDDGVKVRGANTFSAGRANSEQAR